MFMMKSKVVSQPSVVSDILFEVLTKRFVKDGASQFQNFRVHFKISHSTLYDYQLGWAITSFAQDSFRKCSRGCVQNAENGFDFQSF
jgi:hypothetical protein